MEILKFQYGRRLLVANMGLFFSYPSDLHLELGYIAGRELP